MQKKLLTSSLMIMALAVGFVTVTPQHSLAASYYPKVKPNLWYALPGQELTFSGRGYAPYATVTIQGGDGTITATADARGRFLTNPVTVPYKWQNTKEKFIVHSSSAAYDIPLTLTVGTFYPTIEPSSYYVGYGESMSAAVQGFAPNEPVMLLANGALVAQVASNAQGAAVFAFTAPTNGATFELTAQGFYSGVFVSRTIKLY